MRFLILLVTIVGALGAGELGTSEGHEESGSFGVLTGGLSPQESGGEIALPVASSDADDKGMKTPAAFLKLVEVEMMKSPQFAVAIGKISKSDETSSPIVTRVPMKVSELQQCGEDAGLDVKWRQMPFAPGARKSGPRPIADIRDRLPTIGSGELVHP